MTDHEAILRAATEDGQLATLVYSDWLEEHDLSDGVRVAEAEWIRMGCPLEGVYPYWSGDGGSGG